MDDSIVKQVRVTNYHVKGKTAKFMFSGENLSELIGRKGDVYGGLRKPLWEMATHIILHVGTNDVPTKKATKQIAKNIVNLAIKLKRNCDISMINTRRKQQM